MKLYIGTYTRLGGPGIGYGVLTTEALTLEGAYRLANPTYLIQNRAKDRLYAVSSDAPEGGQGGGVAAFAVTDTGLRLLSIQSTVGLGPCHLCLSAEEAYLYVANYHTGSISVFPVTSQGLGEIIQHIPHEGGSVHPTRQASAHAHQITRVPQAMTGPETSMLCCVDLGMDALMMYTQDPRTGLLRPHSRWDAGRGLGPRHIAYGTDGYAYLAHELGSRVETLQYTGGGWVSQGILSTLPPDYTGENTAAAIRLDKARGLLYVSNRGHDSLAAYRTEGRGKLQPLGVHPTGGAIPRDFAVLEDGSLLIAHQDGILHHSTFDAQRGISTLHTLDIQGGVCVCV